MNTSRAIRYASASDQPCLRKSMYTFAYSVTRHLVIVEHRWPTRQERVFPLTARDFTGDGFVGPTSVLEGSGRGGP